MKTIETTVTKEYDKAGNLIKHTEVTITKETINEYQNSLYPYQGPMVTY